MNENRKWIRVSKEESCRICNHNDWCTYTLDKISGSCCMRSTEGGKLLKNGGYFFAFDEARPMPPPMRPAKEKPPAPDFGVMMRSWLHPIDGHISKLDLPAQSLRQIGTAWSEERKALAFPMYDATCHNGTRPIGIRLRTEDGKKFAVTGSTSGIFYPYGAVQTISPFDRLYICEGPTDTVAALAMGCFAIGRASCRGGEGFVLSVLEQLCPDEVVIVTDNDGPGVLGAKDLLRHIKQPKRLLTPPSKDLRSFRQNGGSKELLEELLKNIVRK